MPEPIFYSLIGAVSMLLMVVIVALIVVNKKWARIEATLWAWLRGPYESSLYAAMSEAYKGEKGSGYSDWLRNWRLLTLLPFRLLPSLRRSIERQIHNVKEDRNFDGEVRILADLVRPEDQPYFKLRLWRIRMLDSKGQQVALQDGIKHRSAISEETHRKIFTDYRDAAQLLIENHWGWVEKVVEREKALQSS